ncbi:unnamed protein product [Cuscuta campestris]|uniref:Uncharacterized protein n=1 Tax=Cuscuta campestris TaxID=132261 RepID=A0A484M3Q2_9ASTE|nr:unnamed protein product [Cuscuta campestris]
MQGSREREKGRSQGIGFQHRRFHQGYRFFSGDDNSRARNWAYHVNYPAHKAALCPHRDKFRTGNHRRDFLRFRGWRPSQRRFIGDEEVSFQSRNFRERLPSFFKQKDKGVNQLLPYAGPFSKPHGKHSIFIESKRYDFHLSGSLNISELKNGYIRTISISTTLALWLIESLESYIFISSEWACTRFEGTNSVSINWSSNYYGDFVQILAVFEGARSTICVPLGARKNSLKLFIKGLYYSLNNRNAQVGQIPPPPDTALGEERKVSSSQPQLRDGPLLITSVGSEEVSETDLPKWQDPLLDDILGKTEMQNSNISVPGLLVQMDISDFCSKEYNLDICCKGDFDEEFILLEPLFSDHFESLFKESYCYLKEAMTISMVRDKLQKGILKNGKGKAFRMTRQLAKSIEAVDSVKIKDNITLLDVSPAWLLDLLLGTAVLNHWVGLLLNFESHYSLRWLVSSHLAKIGIFRESVSPFWPSNYPCKLPKAVLTRDPFCFIAAYNRTQDVNTRRSGDVTSSEGFVGYPTSAVTNKQLVIFQTEAAPNYSLSTSQIEEFPPLPRKILSPFAPTFVPAVYSYADIFTKDQGPLYKSQWPKLGSIPQRSGRSH